MVSALWSVFITYSPCLVRFCFPNDPCHANVHVPSNTKWIVQGFHQFYCDEKGRWEGWVTVKEWTYQDLCQNIVWDSVLDHSSGSPIDNPQCLFLHDLWYMSFWSECTDTMLPPCNAPHTWRNLLFTNWQMHHHHHGCPTPWHPRCTLQGTPLGTLLRRPPLAPWRHRLPPAAAVNYHRNGWQLKMRRSYTRWCVCIPETTEL